MAKVERVHAPAEKIRREIPKERRTPAQQAAVDAYAAAREAVGARIFPAREWSRLYHITPRITLEERRSLVQRAATTFSLSQRSAQRRWDEFKKLDRDGWIEAFSEAL